MPYDCGGGGLKPDDRVIDWLRAYGVEGRRVPKQLAVLRAKMIYSQAILHFSRSRAEKVSRIVGRMSF